MAELQRSSVSFRRQGSSGLIWDDKLLSGELKRFSERKPPSSDGDPVQTAGNDQSKCCSKTTIRSVNTDQRNRSKNGGDCAPKAPVPATEPASPRVRVCGLCRAFGKRNETRTRR
ncbi:hypothetical protein SSX86_002326 [Deinandra increscens subsp. villosa]|uniref:Uncharacterized protein n=1 Tax=Deinandra increscens subsp. villosa TaxID=3103831 RepID=A0AAP0H9H8_9ASTR